MLRLDRCAGAARGGGRAGAEAGGPWILLLTVAWGLLVSSCATPEAPVPKAAMDVALDSGGTRMFYKGTAAIPRGFTSATSFELDLDLTAWSDTAEGPVSIHAKEALGERFQGSGLFQPLSHGEGVISLAAGRILLRGKVLADGEELDGHWFLDGKRGGGFRIARKGTIFP